MPNREKNEGDRLRRERIKFEKLKTQPAVQRGRPRKHPIKQPQPPKVEKTLQFGRKDTLPFPQALPPPSQPLQHPPILASQQLSQVPTSTIGLESLQGPASERPSSPPASILPQHGLASPFFGSPNVFSTLNFPSPPLQGNRGAPSGTTPLGHNTTTGLSPMLPLTSPEVLQGNRQLPMIMPYGQHLTTPELRELHLQQRTSQILQLQAQDRSRMYNRVAGGVVPTVVPPQIQQADMTQRRPFASPDLTFSQPGSDSFGEISRHLEYGKNNVEEEKEEDSSDCSDQEDEEVAI
mmetsp:Transcript_12328/g.26978  ORF Transcript_12328/g.26978 Transcript_12328/m.26978 type:complete len:293 (-) Transcript_12328:559-1437(-)